jgi:hypothetical protein
MAINTSKIVPTAFWIGLLALGFVTNVVGPGKERALLRRAGDASRTAEIDREPASPTPATPPRR